MRYHVYLEGEPTLESYRLSHQPRPGYAPVFICPFVVLTDSAGRLLDRLGMTPLARAQLGLNVIRAQESIVVALQREARERDGTDGS